MIGLVIIIVILLLTCLIVLLNINENIYRANHNRCDFELKQLNQMESIRGILKHFDKL